MRKSKSKRKQLNCRVAIEIQSSRVAMVVAEKDGPSLSRIRGHQMVWVQEAASLASDDAVRELSAALATFVNKGRITGAAVHLSLSSELCVTRVAAGDAESLGSEIRNLHERSSQYLSLGAGEKAVAESTRAIDAKRSQTWLTVANKQVLDNIVEAVERAGLQVDFVEHSLVAMCRVIGAMEHDADQPVILIDINQRGVDLGVSYQGQLLFDYRPGGIASKDHIAEIVGRHLERIQRYCSRQFQFISGRISEVFICGDTEDMENVREQFESSHLRAEILDPTAICPNWKYDGGFVPDAHFVASMGSLLVEPDRLQQPRSERGLSDLMDSYRNSWREPLIPALIKNCWPIAATVLLAVGIYAAAFYQSSRAQAIEAKRSGLDDEVQQVNSMQAETASAQKKITHLKQIRTAMEKRAYHRLVASLAQSLPDGVWLETVRVDDDGAIAIQGPGESEDLIFAFVNELKKVPMLTEVSLEGQRPVRLERGPAIRFDIKCRYSGRNDSIGRTASND